MYALKTLSLLLAAALGANAAPASSLATRDVYDPPVLYPHYGTVWIVGNHHNVTWDTSNPPKQITNPIGTIVLTQNGRFLSGAGGPDDPLASNFSILLGRIVVQVPQVAPGTYQLVLFGDSGNASQNFTIVD